MSDSTSTVDHYAVFDEASRLASPFGTFEFHHTKELVARHLPHHSCNVLDAGGASGAHAFWMAELGHVVHLMDVVPKHIEAAAKRQRDGEPLASLVVGDARALPFDDSSMDVVLLAGPLYHLVQSNDRHRTLCQALRVLRPGGILMAVAITRYAGVIYALTEGLVFQPAYLKMIHHELSTGVRTNPPPGCDTFPEAYFHTPEELRAELDAAGFDPGPCLGILGPVWNVPNLAEAWADPSHREVLMTLARHLENEPALGPKLFCAARKPS